MKLRNLLESKHYDIFITTAAMEFPSSFTAKYEWLKEHFDFLNEMNFVFCGDKSIICADFLMRDILSISKDKEFYLQLPTMLMKLDMLGLIIG
jgi:5'(3')-deoxyribonucleotidase